MSTTVKTSYEGKYIVRANGAGVFFGEIVSRDKDIVTMRDARRIYRWAGALSVTDIAVNGISESSKVTCAVGAVEIFNVLEINRCSDAAIKIIEGIDPWTK